MLNDHDGKVCIDFYIGERLLNALVNNAKQTNKSLNAFITSQDALNFFEKYITNNFENTNYKCIFGNMLQIPSAHIQNHFSPKSHDVDVKFNSIITNYYSKL
ncbi:hypothetical protein [Legionella gresilensis]|uniref:hypothetical protein n=1 Tax=Legionella gresilensis TaxID=91823 RepID=UPI00104172CA|nr:hypothetical protein [Legionella gresilensis]